MVKIKRFKQFNEDAMSTGSVAGMGNVVSAQPGVVAGTQGSTGSGDIGFGLITKDKKRKKGNPSDVSDMRFLSPAKGINHVDEVKDKS